MNGPPRSGPPGSNRTRGDIPPRPGCPFDGAWDWALKERQQTDAGPEGWRERYKIHSPSRQEIKDGQIPATYCLGRQLDTSELMPGEGALIAGLRGKSMQDAAGLVGRGPGKSGGFVAADALAERVAGDRKVMKVTRFGGRGGGTVAVAAPKVTKDCAIPARSVNLRTAFGDFLTTWSGGACGKSACKRGSALRGAPTIRKSMCLIAWEGFVGKGAV